MQLRSLRMLGAVLLGAIAACSSEPSASPGPPPDAGPTEPLPPVFTDAVTIDQVSFYQGVKIALVKGGDAAVVKTPIIAKRPALVRVHARRAVGAKIPKVLGKLHVKTGSGQEVVLTDGPKSLANYLDADLASTFNFELTAEQITPDLQISVELVETTSQSTLSYPAADADTLSIALPAIDAPKLRVKLVPVKYEADGSDRLPTLDEANVKAYRDALYKMFPVSEVEMSIRAPLAWPVEVEPTGNGWSQLLSAMMATRDEDKAEDDVYYMGVFNPAASVSAYCAKSSCILGVAPASGLSTANEEKVSLRTALVLGYQSEKSGGTFAQELAHAMGRAHAPCGAPKAIDPKYPYADAGIGSAGWDVLKKELVDSDGHSDFMSYCSPVWVSDYTFTGIYNRMVKIAEGKTTTTTATQPQMVSVKSYSVAPDGKLTEGPSLRMPRPDARDAFVLETATHEKRATIHGDFHAVSGTGGGILLVAEDSAKLALARTDVARAVAMP